ncbi:MAG: DNA polymerase III subunit delta [Bacteroidales bacterium]|nr:DNA polymerase III subunit delta [Bacteroidales bacterium]
MAGKGYIETERQCRNLVEDAKNGIFKPVYLLMGAEPYYPDLVCDAILSHALQEWERDFNETVCYGADVDADTVITAARRFPMMAERQVVVVKEAQAMKSLEELAVYCQNPLDSTILVLLMRGASADKRKALYKSVLKNGVVVESNPLKDYEMAGWIVSYYSDRGLRIDPEAAALLGEFAGTDLSKIAVETDKLLKNLPEGAASVTVEDIESNVGISRQFSIFELTRELSYKNAGKALRIAAHIGETPRFAMPMAVSALFLHFYRILKYEALLMKDPRPAADLKARILGVSPYFMREYDAAVAAYPMKKCMAVISLLNDYDFKGKGGETGETAPGDLLVELITKILNI